MKPGAIIAIVGSVVAAAAVGTVAVVGYHRRSSSPGPLPTVLLGDSLAVGLASPLRMAGLPLHSIAVGGTNAAYWVNAGKAALQAALATKPAGVMVSLGTNDAFYGGDTYAATAAGAAKKLVELITAAGGMVYWIGPPKLPVTYGGGKLSQAVLDAIRQTVEALPGTYWIDSSALDIDRSADKLHPTGAGYSHWADLIIDQLGLAFVSPSPEGVAGDFFGADADPEPTPRPPPPSVIVVPSGWRYARAKERTAAAAARATVLLFEKHPMGDLQTAEIDGTLFGFFREWHWDDHVAHKWMWHPGITLLRREA